MMSVKESKLEHELTAEVLQNSSQNAKPEYHISRVPALKSVSRS